MNELLETKKLDKVLLLKFLKNSSSIKLERFELFKPKLSKLISKLKLKLEKFIFTELNMGSNSKFTSSMKLEFDEM